MSIMGRRLDLPTKKKFVALRRAFAKPVIGVTGNVGKTTTISMIDHVLSRQGKVLRNQRNYGNWQNNVNLLERLSPDYDYAIFEFDFYRSESFAEILRIIKPNVGIVTNVGDAHLCYIGGMIDIALKRSEVVKYLARNGTAVLNKDDELSAEVAEHIDTSNILRFGLSQAAEYYARDIEHCGPQGTRLNLNGQYVITIPVHSIGDIYNFLAATAALVAVDVPLTTVIDAFQQNFELPAGRGRLHVLNGYYVIDESYKSTPRSVAKAARSLVGFKPYCDHLVYIIGDMIESGPNVEQQHLNMGYFLSALPIDCVIPVGYYAQFIGKGMSLIQNKNKQVIPCNTTDQILNVLNNTLNKTSVITVQGLGQVALRRILTHIEQK
jgi:UDP-N-acetylmuramoyl-tripeptide--D-alanyl-D-alanine ligase